VTSTPLMNNGWHSGMRSGVFFAAWIPAILATASASPFGTEPSRRAATQSVLSSTRPAAVAERAVTALSETSTIRASPVALRCGKRSSLTTTPESSRRLVQQPHVDVLPGSHELDLFGQDHQCVRSGKIGEQVGAVSTSKFDLAITKRIDVDNAAG
jgi:hypothetical protein